jgi:hypothetical protein
MIEAYWRERGYRVVCAIIDDPDTGTLLRSDLGATDCRAGDSIATE